MSLDADIRRLGSNPIFTHLEFDALRLLAFSADTQILRAGDVLFKKGERADGGIYVMRGIVILDYSSDTLRDVRRVGPDHLIGEMALLTETARQATAIAGEPTTVLKIHRTLFLKVLGEYPEAAESIRNSIFQTYPALCGTCRKRGSHTRTASEFKPNRL